MSQHSQSTIIDAFSANSLLGDSHVIRSIHGLLQSLQYESDGQKVSFDEYSVILMREVDQLPYLTLQPDVAPGGESKYSIQLVTAMEKVQDDCDRTLRRVIKFSSRLAAARSQMKKLSAAFGAWYTLAANEAVERYGVKFPTSQIKALAESEFSRLLEGADCAVEEAAALVEAMESEVKQHKKTQQEKFNMGKDQVNASWTSHMPSFGNAVGGDGNDRLLKSPKVEMDEDVEEVPAYISKSRKQENNPVLNPPEQHEIKGTFKKTIGPVKMRPIATVSSESIGGALPEGAHTFVSEGYNAEVVTIGEPEPCALNDVTFDAQVASLRKHIEEAKNDPDYDLPCHKNLITSPGISVEEVMSLRTTIDEIVDSPDYLVVTKEWSEQRWKEIADAEPGGIMACSPEILDASGGDVNNTLAIHDTAMGMMKAELELQNSIRAAGGLDETTTTAEEIGKDFQSDHLNEPLTGEEVMEVLKQPSPLATPVPTKPRRKLQIITDDEEIL